MIIEFGKKMRAIREERDWTLEEMAQRLGTTKQALSKYERGERTPKITVAAKFAEILGVPLKELVGTEDPSEYYNEALKEKVQQLETIEARIISGGIDKMPQEKREEALRILQAIFTEYFGDGGKLKK